MRRLNALVVDDEPLARERMTRLLEEAGCEVVGNLGNGLALLEWLQGPAEADVIFLDIQMPGPNCMEVLADARNPPPVVFVTAFSEYAVRAFELSAVDYLLKPVFEERLFKCLQRVRERLVRRLSPSELRSLLPTLPRFPILAGEGEIFMELSHVTHFELSQDRVWAFRGLNRYLTRWTTLSDVEDAFPEEGMLRIQRHILLRPEMVRGFRPLATGRIKVLVAPRVELTVSRAMTPTTRKRIDPATK
ncbi:LytTR family DNA-binding domain-containing protein [Geothrix sp. 21YS21S-2]|uniref:LytR/AlgR family response regulator transcription factor n=1 Tax=Geothrix sp. 21YS21S-2 TaxID=3068893 RepID=UPI0027B913A7|nr:response regulator transcription factor [Geothrix sp. 21YS21S-2]